MNTRLPDFLLLGPPRTGTTWLHSVLKTVPGVYLPEEKQVHFFDKSYDKGLEWYAAKFGDSKTFDTIGEITPDYVIRADYVARIEATIPNVKVISIFRDPIERAVSHYKIRSRRGLYSGKSFSEVFRDDIYLMEGSRYGKQLERLLESFPERNILLLNFDSLNVAPQEVVHEILDFIDVPFAEISEEILRRRYSLSLPDSRVDGFDRNLIKLREFLKPVTARIEDNRIGFC